MRGMIYWNTSLYHIAMKGIYGKGFETRYKVVAENVVKGWRVLDLCCGDCYIVNFLDGSVRYEGRDFNNLFLNAMRRKGLKVSYSDLKNDFNENTKFDCVMMMGSLHQFIPDEDSILRKMKAIASKRIIISEPCKNIISTRNPIVSFLAKIISKPDDERISSIKRFDYDGIIAIFKRHGATRIINAGKDVIGVFDL